MESDLKRMALHTTDCSLSTWARGQKAQEGC